MFRRGSLLFLLLMVVHLAGFYVYFVFRLHTIHEQARAELINRPDHQLARLELTAREFESLGGDDGEIRYNGRMYDIARTEAHGDRMVVFALHDADEDDLLAFIAAVAKTADQDHQQAPQAFTFFLSLTFLPTAEFIFPDLCGRDIRHFTRPVIFHQNQYDDPADRPPLS